MDSEQTFAEKVLTPKTFWLQSFRTFRKVLFEAPSHTNQVSIIPQWQAHVAKSFLMTCYKENVYGTKLQARGCLLWWLNIKPKNQKVSKKYATPQHRNSSKYSITYWGGRTRVVGWAFGLRFAETPIWLAERFRDCWFKRPDASPAWYCNWIRKKPIYILKYTPLQYSVCVRPLLPVAPDSNYSQSGS